MSELKGTLKITKYGFGLIITKDPSKTIKVDKRDLNNNFGGDEVTYVIKKDNGKTQFAEVTSKPNYKNRDFIGIVHHSFKTDVFIYNYNIGKSNLVLCDSIKIDGVFKNEVNLILSENNFVKFTITKYKNKLFYGKIIENFGSFYDNLALSKYVIEFNNLKDEFPDKVIKKSKKCENKYYSEMDEEIKKRKDLRNIVTFTIDPKGARDLDDAISIIKTDEGYKAFVHIADVSYFISKGNSIDMEAKKRSFSVYLPTQVIRMLPPLLSENLCSLLPDSDKYAVTTEIDISNDGKILKWDIYKSVIRSNYKYTYEEVFNILENNVRDQFTNELILLKDLSSLLKSNKLKLPDKKLNDNLEMELSYADYSHTMIEEMMILNNILVAKTLYNKGINYPSRYHGPPDYQNNGKLIELIEKVNNITLSKIDVRQLQTLVNVEEHTNKLINLNFIQRILSKAKYDSTKSGHWALNLDFYSHFTSPIRRYPDLISHRLIFGDSFKEDTLNRYLKENNDNEMNHQQIEFYIDKVKIIRHLSSTFEKNINKEFEAYILDIRNPTLNIFIPSLFWSDELHIADITNDKMSYDDEKKIFYNDDKVISHGMKIKLKVKKIKIAFLELDFEVAKV